jgi:hypothetical protein
MPVFSGNTSTSAASTAANIETTIKSFSLSNKSGGAITISVSVISGSTNILITPLNHSLAAGEMYEDDKDIRLLPYSQIYVLVSGSCDYYFSTV